MDKTYLRSRPQYSRYSEQVLTSDAGLAIVGEKPAEHASESTPAQQKRLMLAVRRSALARLPDSATESVSHRL